MQTDAGRPVPVRVVLVDADDRVRESLCGLICIGDRIEVVGSGGRPDAALDLVRETRPDVVVLDPRLPDLEGGLSFIVRVRETAPGIRIVVLGGADADEQRDLAGVADAFVRKTFRPNDLVAAVLGTFPLAS